MSLFATEASAPKYAKKDYSPTPFVFHFQMTDIYLPLLVGATVYFAQKVGLLTCAYSSSTHSCVVTTEHQLHTAEPTSYMVVMSLQVLKTCPELLGF